jgi:beta-lactamase class A
MLWLLPFLLVVFLQAQPSAVELLEKVTVSKVDALGGVVGFAAVDLKTGRVFGRNTDTVFAQASSIKIPIMMRVFELIEAGKLNLSDPVTLDSSQSVGGSGHLQKLLKNGSIRLSLEELITAMIETSDNTATNQLIAMAGMESVNRMLDRYGFKKTRLQRMMLDGPAARRGEENVSTPREMAGIAQLIYQEKPPGSKKMIAILKLVKADFRATIPAHVEVAAKPGSVPGIHCETGIVFLDKHPFTLSVMAGFLDTGHNPVPAITRIVYDHFEKLGRSNAFGHRVD